MSKVIAVGSTVYIDDEQDASNYSGVGKVVRVDSRWVTVAGDWGIWDFPWRRVKPTRVVPNPNANAGQADEPDFVDPSLKATNPKDAVGSDKLPLHLWPETATLMGTLGMLDGMLKYGRTNWRKAGIRTSIYIDALRRHINAYAEGEDLDPDSGVPHLAHALACLAILVDAGASGNLTDDRQYPGGYRALVEELTPHVKRLKEKHADKDPKHYTIGDA